MTPDFLTWCEYFFRTELYDRNMPHVMVDGFARVWPPVKHMSDAFARRVRSLLRLDGWRGPGFYSARRLTHDQIIEVLDQHGILDRCLRPIPTPLPTTIVACLR